MRKFMERFGGFLQRAPPNVRCFSHKPSDQVYGGPKQQSVGTRVGLRELQKKYTVKEPITMVTAYDYPSAVHVDQAGIDICLVGDSAGMVVHGYDTTLPMTIEDMLTHCRAVSRGANRPFLVGDLPFGSYEQSNDQAVSSAVRMLKEGGMDAIKLEGGSVSRVAAVKAIAEAGIAVMGHVGLTPQSISVLGGFRPQGRDATRAIQVVEQALALQVAGCFAIVLECLPAPVAAAITRSLQIPTIGIGAGPDCSGQVLVYHDLLGMMQHPHHAKVTPKFCKQYVRVGDLIHKGLVAYREEVSNGGFPSAAHTPYRIDDHQMQLFVKGLESKGYHAAAEAATTASSDGRKLFALVGTAYASSLNEEQRRQLVNRLLYRSKQRGFLELDLVLGKWTEENIHKLDDGHLDALVQVLNLENPDLWKWLTGQADVPESISNNPVFSSIKEQINNNLERHSSSETRAQPGKPWVRGWDDFKKSGPNTSFIGNQ